MFSRVKCVNSIMSVQNSPCLYFRRIFYRRVSNKGCSGSSETILKCIVLVLSKSKLFQQGLNKTKQIQSDDQKYRLVVFDVFQQNTISAIYCLIVQD